MRMNWRQSSKNWKELSWRNSFCNLQQQLLFECLQEGNRLGRLKMRMMSWRSCRERWPFKEGIITSAPKFGEKCNIYWVLLLPHDEESLMSVISDQNLVKEVKTV